MSSIVPSFSTSTEPLSWIHPRAPAQEVEGNVIEASPWYLGGRDVVSWSSEIAWKMGQEKTTIISSVERIIQVVLTHLEDLKEAIPSDRDWLQVLTVRYEGKPHNFCLLRDNVFFELPLLFFESTEPKVPVTVIATVDLKKGRIQVEKPF